jgi:hypothetical protein
MFPTIKIATAQSRAAKIRKVLVMDDCSRGRGFAGDGRIAGLEDVVLRGWLMLPSIIFF